MLKGQIFSSVEKKYCDKMIKIANTDKIYIIDEKGKEYIDAISGLWNKNLGYKVPEISQKIIEQFEICESINPWLSTTQLNESYSKDLLDFSGYSEGSIYLSLSGSESLEVAIKAARKYQVLQRNKEKKIILTFDNGYHGGTIGAWSISGNQRGLIRPYSPLMNGTAFVPFIHDDKTFQSFCKYINAYGEKTAAFIIEPTLGFGGGFEIPVKYMIKIQEICKINDILLIFDEVSTGFYRTGKRFAFEKYKLRPDILCLSKGLNNGVLPFGATIFKEKIFGKIRKNDMFAHFSTQDYNPLLTASGKAVLDIYKENDFETNNEMLSNEFKQNIKLTLQPYLERLFIDGLFITMEFKKITSYKDVRRFFYKLIENGLIVYTYSNHYGSGLILAPMYITSKEECQEIIRIIERTYLEWNE